MSKTVVSHRKYGEEFEEIVKDILSHPYFERLNQYEHHGKKRFDHSVLVAYNSFVIAKKANLDVISVARGALLHDFFFDETLEKKRAKRKKEKGLKKLTSMQAFTHPERALNNAEKHFELNELEKDIICKHMFPLTFEMPKYSESWIVNGVDTSIAIKEMFEALCRNPILTLTGRMNSANNII